MTNELALRLFVSVIEENSFSKGGARLGIPQSSASRMISGLEKNLDVRLIHRSTRKLTLTEAGLIYFERVRKIVIELDEAENAVKGINSEPAGLLRVTAPAIFGRKFIAPNLTEFHDLFPAITVALSLTDIVEDVIGLGFDLGIRHGALENSSLISRPLARSNSIICASPIYLDRYGCPTNIKELENHNCLLFRSSPGSNTWSFVRDGTDYHIKTSGSLYSNSGDALMSAAVAGLGIAYLPDWVVYDDIKAGTLKHILPEYEEKSGSVPIQIVYAHREHIPAKVEAFSVFLKRKLKIEYRQQT